MPAHTLDLAIKSILAKLDTECPVARTATDEDVAGKLREMAARHGYRPSEQIIEPVRAYLSGYSILLTGETGVGKTFLMRCLCGSVRPADDIASWGLAWTHGFYSWTDELDIVIDDLGSERTVAEYGAKDEVLKAVIAHRLDGQTARHRKGDINPARVGRTHITTNLTAEQIAERYGDRTLSRITGMCKSFRIEGPHMRKPSAIGRDGN
jgi:ATPase subunit of ABC transporter with duplicated ATPase domains